MKKIIFAFWSFFTSKFLQIILLIFAYISWLEAVSIGSIVSSKIGKGGSYLKHLHEYDAELGAQNVGVAITSGYNGGAMAMGLITCICIFGVVWLEINKQSKP